MSLLSRLVPDRFVITLLATVVVASLLPVRGTAADIAAMVSSAAIFLLFFLHGLRTPRAEVIGAIRNWRLQLIIFGFVFGAMPVAGLIAAPIGASFLPQGLVIGLLFLGILPSTVQSAISYASIAGGNIAASVMASAFLNLSGIIVTPLLTALVIGQAGGGALGWGVVIKIVSILLLPFACGQALQRAMGGWASRQRAMLSIMDKSAIAIAVYVAFSSAVAGGLWQQVDLDAMLMLIVLISAMLAFALFSSWGIGGLAGFSRPDRITMLFAASHKSIATGAPLAAILFTGPQAGMVILPALIYHQLQLIVSAPLANRLARFPQVHQGKPA